MRDASPDRLRSQPGYPAFLGAATLGRLADEMLPVTVVLFVLDRTGRPGLAGLTVAAAAFPSVLTGPSSASGWMEPAAAGPRWRRTRRSWRCA
jgi:hypothetical protein